LINEVWLASLPVRLVSGGNVAHGKPAPDVLPEGSGRTWGKSQRMPSDRDAVAGVEAAVAGECAVSRLPGSVICQDWRKVIDDKDLTEVTVECIWFCSLWL